MPVYEFPSDRGDLIVTYTVELPKSLTYEQQESKYQLNHVLFMNSVQKSILYVS